jgi:hypothetical protein
MQPPPPKMLHWVNLRTILRIEMRGGVFECASATSRTGEVQIGAVGGVWVEYRGLSIVIKLDMKIDLKINSEAANRSTRP